MVIVIIVGGVYWPTLESSFSPVDDGINVYANTRLLDNASDLTSWWRTPYEHLYIPIVYNLWSALAATAQTPHVDADGFTFPLDPAPFHAVNIGVHAANAILVFALLLLICKDRLAALIGALLFALHPLQVESVSWVTGLKDLLSTSLALLSILFYRSSLAVEAPGTGARRGPWQRTAYLLSIGAYGLSLLAKPGIIALPGVLLLLGWLSRPGEKISRHLPRLFPYGGLAVAVSIVTWVVQETESSGLRHDPGWGRLYLAADALVFYAAKVLWPTNLCPQYGRVPALVIANPQAPWLACSVIGCLLCLARFRQNRQLMLGVGTLAFGLLPVLGFVSFRYQSESTVANRYMYFAILGPIILAAVALARARVTVRLALGVSLMITLAALTLRDLKIWRTPRTYNLGVMACHERNLARDPNDLVVQGSAGIVMSLKHYSGASRRLGAAIRGLHIKDPETWAAYAAALVGDGHVALAERALARVVRDAPRAGKARLVLADMLFNRGLYHEALDHYRELVRLFPERQELRERLAQRQPMAAGQKRGGRSP